MRDLPRERPVSLRRQGALKMGSRLRGERSAYLRAAAHQPVNWYPWCEEAFERARAEGKPILLDIGAAWCHWCHVMDSESYENPQIADLLNREWICIKVDRDERPEVDARYQRAVQVLTGQGGWPLTAFLTPDGEVFYGGTYFPPEGKYGQPGFASVLRELARIYREEPQRIHAQASQITRRLEELVPPARPGALTPSILDEAVERMARAFDFRHGGFGTQPKFPHPGACDFLLARWFDTRERPLREMVDRTLIAIAKGGIHDQLGGGFHRYSVDSSWIVPHFEKLSSDNAELLRVYLHADASLASADGEEVSLIQENEADDVRYRDVAAGIVSWVRETLTQEGGGYGASQDADVGPGDDGDYFTWTAEEVRQVVNDAEYQAVSRRYDIDEAGEMHHNPGKNVLWVKQSIKQIASAMGCSPEQVRELLQSARRKLKAARDRRPQPAVDPSIYTGWNAMMAAAMLEASVHLDRPELEEHALATLKRIFSEGVAGPGRGVTHALGGDLGGVLEDQVQVAAAALDAHEATGDPQWLVRSVELMDFVWTNFHLDDGLLVDLLPDRRGVGLLRHSLRPLEDGPAPSGNGLAAWLMLRLSHHDQRDPWFQRAEALLRSASGLLGTLSLHAATMLRAADWYLNPVVHVVIAGDPEDPRVRELHRAARSAYRPRKLVTFMRPGQPGTRLPEPLRGAAEGRAPQAYVCTDRECAPPASSASELVATLASLGL